MGESLMLLEQLTNPFTLKRVEPDGCLIELLVGKTWGRSELRQANRGLTITISSWSAFLMSRRKWRGRSPPR